MKRPIYGIPGIAILPNGNRLTADQEIGGPGASPPLNPTKSNQNQT